MTVPLRAARNAPASPSLEECDKLVSEYRLRGIEAATTHLRTKLEALAEEVSALLDDSVRSETSASELQLVVTSHRFKEQIRTLARENEQFFGTFASLMRRYRFEEPADGPTSWQLSIMCIEELFCRLAFKNISLTNVDDVVFNAWLGILTTS